MENEFLQMVNTHNGIVHKVCRLYCREPEDQRDLCQEIVLQLWRAFPAFRGQAKRSTWVYRIALNTAVSSYRKRSKQIVHTASDNDWRAIDQPISMPQDDEPMQQFYRAVDQLSPVEKAIVFLYLDDNSYDEMARIIGISVSNVGVKLNRIKGKLKKIIAVNNA